MTLPNHRSSSGFFFLVFILLLSLQSHASSVFDFNTNCQAAYKEIFSLRIKNGQQLVSKEKSQHPDNLIPLLLESYIDLLNVITTDNESLLEQLKTGKDSRMEILKKADKTSPWYRYAQAEVQLHFALAALQYQQYWPGMTEMRKAYSLLEENIRLYPEFKPSLKSYYAIQALLGAVPEKYAWGLNALGMKGNLPEAMDAMGKLVAADWGTEAFLRDEAAHIYILLLFHLDGDKKKAWGALTATGYPLEGNLYSYYTALKISLFSYHNDAALQLLEKNPQGEQYAAMPVLKYYAGLAYLNKLDMQKAIGEFQRFLDTQTGNNYKKSANQKLAWCYLIQGDTDTYKKYRAAINATGAAQTEADKQAQKEAEDPLQPYPGILKARLLFDGGYFKESLKTLESIQPETLTNKIYELELVYRTARVLHEMNDTVRAIERYMVAIGKGKNEPYYYAANSALNLGLIYESKGNKEMAKHYFNLCLQMDNHEYKASLGQKAKAGLERLKK